MTLMRIGISVLLLTAGFSLWGQSLSKGDSLMRECRFEAAMWAFLQARDDEGEGDVAGVDDEAPPQT